jgi:two-component system, cell cycle response regulator
VAELSLSVGRSLGMTPEELDELARAAELHDIGKIAIPDAILDKPGPLDPAEWSFMRRHTIIGERIMLSAPALAPVAHLVRSTHERWDGTGYPDGLEGGEIPLGSRIVAVCDAFDAMTSDRPYRRALPAGEALEEVSKFSGTQFDPTVVEQFRRAYSEQPPVREVTPA